MKYEIKKGGMIFHAAHRLDEHVGLCQNLHGHSYQVEVTLGSDSLDIMDMVIDFGDVNRTIKKWIDDNLDHCFIYDVNDKISNELALVLHKYKLKTFAMQTKPTAERMSELFMKEFTEMFKGTGVFIMQVIVWETNKARSISNYESSSV